MGGRHSKRTKAKISLTIPNFPYPQNILDYLLGISSGYNITFDSPDGKTGTVATSGPTSASTTTPIPTTAVPTTPIPTTPMPYEATPSYSTTEAPTSAPTKARTRQPAKPTRPLVAPTLPPQTPPFWFAAIKSMEFVNDLGPITTAEQLNRLYSNLKEQIPIFMGDGTVGAQNLSALIYFNSIISLSFAPFNEVFSYNHLNGKFPQVFSNGRIYRKICMLNFYSIHSSKVFKKLKNGYILPNDRVMLYMVPQVLKAVLELLSQNTDQ
jgi:hypothetical protein